ncbi:uncharacterized protein METZ01_LOCUS33130 [marine metagenome]|uniref:Uncharacterized protein n=1 Tax=marine metagenome TaxID=408172 RepID=A0A381QLN8_9ZZZZ
MGQIIKANLTQACYPINQQRQLYEASPNVEAVS